MITESQILGATQDTNAILAQLLREVGRTNQLLEWLGRTPDAPQEPKTTREDRA